MTTQTVDTTPIASNTILAEHGMMLPVYLLPLKAWGVFDTLIKLNIKFKLQDKLSAVEVRLSGHS